MSDRVLITGGLGFIGYHLASHLLETDPEVDLTIVDNLSSTRIETSCFKGRARVYVQDLCEFPSDRFSFDAVYHLASPVGSIGILARTGHIAEEIVALTCASAKIALNSDARLLSVSSSEVYGREGKHRENAPLQLRPTGGARAEYAGGKALSEVILRNLALVSPLRYNICRPFNVMGEHQSSRIGFVVPTFFERALSGHDIPVYQPGTQVRSFCHVSDIVGALVAVQESSLDGETFNVGSDSNLVSIRDLAEKIRRLCRSESRIITVDPVVEHGQAYTEAFDKVPDLEKIRGVLGWEPTIDLDDGLQRILAAQWSAAEGAAPISAAGRMVVQD
jgi:nucleoside-diphosphate-sugar epimerase